jgi:hypothetical protein
MSFFRKKSGLEIPPVNDAARNELLGSRGGGRSVSPLPPPYRPSDAATYNVSRDGDKYDSEKYYREDSTRSGGGGGNGGPSRGPIPERYATRSAIGDPYARGGDADADRAALFSGYDAEKQRATSGGRNRFDDVAQDNEPRQFQTQEDEDEEVEGIKQQTRWAKQESVQSTRNALRIAREAEETGRNTLLRLGDQSGTCTPPLLCSCIG